jgi:homoserine kinase
MLSTNEETARNVEKIMKGIYEKIGVDYKTYVTTINTEGVKIVDEQ